MSISLYHQVGHNANWNRESFVDDSCGDGLILSPVHQNQSQIEDMPTEIKQHCIFDPQYYLPNSKKNKLNSYDFFPEALSGGFSTKTFPTIALDSAKKCIYFQLAQDFERLIIPARYFDQMDPDYTEKQELYTVNAFLEAISKVKTQKPVCLTLPLTSHMIEHKKYRNMILNWATSFTKIDGVYVIADHQRNTKQIQSESFLDAYLEFLTELREAELEILVGYLNTESLVLSLIDGSSLTFGTFENTRMFSIDKFLVDAEERRGPTPRIYLPGLLNWVQLDQAKQLKKIAPKLWSQIYVPTSYAETVLKAAVEPTFNQPGLYKHHFICFTDQVNQLNVLKPKDRYNKLRKWIQDATVFYKEVAKLPIDLDAHGKGEHLKPWLNSINRYFTDYLRTYGLHPVPWTPP
jgi:hypothetical protein